MSLRVRVAQVMPVRWRAWDDALQAYRLRTVGYRVVCDCGAAFKLRDTWGEARLDLRAHECPS